MKPMLITPKNQISGVAKIFCFTTGNPIESTQTSKINYPQIQSLTLIF